MNYRDSLEMSIRMHLNSKRVLINAWALLLRENKLHRDNKENFDEISIFDNIIESRIPLDKLVANLESLTPEFKLSIFNYANKRKHEFLKKTLENYYTEARKNPPKTPPNITENQKLIVLFDFFTSRNYDKDYLIVKLESVWNDNTRCDKKFEWYSSGDFHEKLESTLSWLSRSNMKFDDKIDSLNNIESILILFDRLYPHPSDREIALIKIKRAHTQKRHKTQSRNRFALNGVVKKQFNVEISEDIVNKIKIITEIERITRAQLIEELVLAEYKKNYPYGNL